MCKSANCSNTSLIFLLLFICLITIILSPTYLFAYGQVAKFICEKGIDYYKKGEFTKAESEFKKALLAQPDYPPAIYYLQLIDEILGNAKKPSHPTHKALAIDKGLIIDRETAMEKFLYDTYPAPIIKTKPKTSLEAPPETLKKNNIAIPKKSKIDEKKSGYYFLDDPRFLLQQPIQIEEGKDIIIRGKNISRFLIVQPDILRAEKLNDNDLSVTAKNIGLSSLIIWDDNGRRVIECSGIMPIPEGVMVEDLMRKEKERTENFKLRYNLDWYSYESGRRLSSIERSGTYSWIHNLRLNGLSPYGLLDSAVTLRKLSTTTDMTYITAGITDGRIGNFKGFNLRAGDYNSYFNNMAIPNVDLRGVYFNSPAFDNKLDYTIFWGRENGGGYGILAYNNFETLHSFLSGFNLNFSPLPWQSYKISVASGWGHDRQDYLKKYAYDFIGDWNFKNSAFSYEIASDTENLAHLLTSRYSKNNFNADLQLRDVDKEFTSITGSGWRQGELGALFNLNYMPTENLSITQRIDIYRDRLYPAEGNPKRFNEDLDTTVTYRLGPLTAVEATYTLQNDLGKMSKTRYQSPGVGINKLFFFFGRDISTYIKYSHQESKNYTTPSLNYTNEKIFGGIRFKLAGALYYFLNKEINWLTERYYGNHNRPHVTETGLDWYDRIGASSFWGALRFTYRDEEKANSPLSFLSGEDYIEGYGELSFKPYDGQELFASCRVRNIWKENNSAQSRIEATFNAGMRLMWDTGLRWDATANIQGYVFKDYNSNGLREKDEPPISGVKIWLGKKEFQITDEFGYFKFPKARGKNVYLTLDTATLPTGYILTVPVTQGVPVVSGTISKIYFGATSRSEIRGIVFEDTNEDGEYSPGEEGIAEIAIILDNEKRSVTNSEGRYIYPQVSLGEHELTADLNTIPVYYLPSVALKKQLYLYEGDSFVWNIPLRRIEEQEGG